MTDPQTMSTDPRQTVLEKVGPDALRQMHQRLREVVVKLDALDQYNWLQYAPRLEGRVSFTRLSRQMAQMKADLNDYFGRQRQLYVDYIRDHPPVVSEDFRGVPVAKAHEIETEVRYHLWLDDVVMRRDWWDVEAMSMATDVKKLEGIMADHLEPVVGEAAEALTRALGSGKAGWNRMTPALARKLVEWGVPGTDQSAEALRRALADRIKNRVQGAYLGDGAGRVLAAATWEYDTKAKQMIVRYLGTQDTLVPGSAIQAVRELAGEAARRGFSLAFHAGDSAQHVFATLGFVREGPLVVMAAEEVGGLAAGFPSTPVGWLRPGFLEGSGRVFSEFTGDTEALMKELVESWPTATANSGQAQAAIAKFGSRMKDVEYQNITTQEAASMHLYVLRAQDGSLDAVALVREAAGKPLYGDRFGARPGRTGSGREMMRHLSGLDSAKENGFLLNSTENAEGFYERIGMTRVADPKGWTGAEYFFGPAEAGTFASGLTGGGVQFGGAISFELGVAGSGDWLRAHKIRGVVDEITAATHRKLVDTLAEGLEEGESIAELSERVQKLDPVFGPVRGERIARTEILTANRMGSYQMAADHGSGRKRWRAMVGDPRTREWHEVVNRQEVGIQENFTVPNKEGIEEHLFLPGVPAEGEEVSAGNLINCRCLVQYIREGVTDEAAMALNQHGLDRAKVKSPGPVYSSLEPIPLRAD